MENSETINKKKFYCFKCKKDFSSDNETIKHLKKNHFMVEKSEAIKCIVQQCDYTFLTFDGLRKHLKSFDHERLQNVSSFKYMIYSVLNIIQSFSFGI